MATKTKAQERAAEYKQRVTAALEEANDAGNAAATAYIKTAKKTPEGLVLDACGYGSIVLYKPSYPLREALKTVGAVTNYSGGWHFNNCPLSTGSQSITVNEKAAQAACEVLKRHFPKEGEFFATSRMD
jgi:hypothetical protein